MPDNISTSLQQIDNAGLVLLHPFLPNYFSRLGLMENNRFVDEQSRLRGALLLQYVVSGAEHYEEHKMVLNKLLLGIPFETPLPQHIVITDNEKEISAQMLGAVLLNWDKMKDTSVDGFRASFLQRVGLLVRENEEWNLRIESRAYDILLQTLPWAFSIIKAPWMQQFLYVNYYDNNPPEDKNFSTYKNQDMPIPTPVSKIEEMSVSVTIKINGEKVKNTYALPSVNVTHEVYEISYAEIVFTGDAMEAPEHPLTDSDDFDPGNEVEIIAGYGDESETTIFKGVIVKHSVDIASAINVKILCKHKAVSTTLNKTDSEFPNQTDSAVISTILGRYQGLSATVDSTAFVQENIFQKSATDWDFILYRAAFLGYIVTQDSDSIFIGKPKLTAEPVLRVSMGESIIAFNAELDAEQQAPSISASAWDIKNRILIKETATEPELNQQGSVTAKSLAGKLNQKAMAMVSLTPMPTEELAIWANGEMLRTRLNAIKGEVTFWGSGIVKTGDLIELAGVGKKFDGSAFVSSVNHIINSGEWHTKVKFGLAKKPINERVDSNAVGQLPAVGGLHIATVQKIFEDPRSQYRILVNIPSNSETQTGFWARLSNLYATSGAGSFFFPEVGDEVIVGFLENDSRYPIILGSAYSNTLKPPIEPVDNNNYIKSIVTKAQLKLSFDDEKKIIKIETPGGNTISLSDDGKMIEIKDGNKNSVKLSESGIDLSSDKDINISGANINLTAKQKIAVSAKMDASVEGNNVNLTAKIGFAAKGTTAEVAGTGQTTIKGGMVMIN